MYDVHGLASFSAAFDKELTDDDWATLTKDFYLSFNKRSLIEKLSPSFVLFIGFGRHGTHPKILPHRRIQKYPQ